jgi:von Willebrand factor type A domain
MRTRHRIPTIFNLSMVDVLCCALGCVILLWLLNFRDARRRAALAGQSSVLLADTRLRLDESTHEADDLRKRLRSAEEEGQRTTALLRSIQADRDRAYVLSQTISGDLDRARSQFTDLTREHAGLKAQASADAELLAKKLQAAEKRLLTLEALTRDTETRATTAARTADDLATRLREAEARVKEFRLLADQLPNVRADSKDARAKLSLTEDRLRMLEKDLSARTRERDDARRRLTDAEGEKRSLVEVANRAREAADNRFAGISLTGRRVVFLIDMSGSMDYVDEKTRAPDKWSGVRETVARIMRSLPDLEKFQVILFEARTSFLLGSDGQWLDFNPRTSIERVTQALAAVTPKGNTNMYSAFNTAFRYRALGLDTIYLLSDGLPNTGDGLSPEAARKMNEFEKGEVLSKHVRKTLRLDWNRSIGGQSRVRIHAIGFFYESPDVGAFLWALARENEGSFVGMSKP